LSEREESKMSTGKLKTLLAVLVAASSSVAACGADDTDDSGSGARAGTAGAGGKASGQGGSSGRGGAKADAGGKGGRAGAAGSSVGAAAGESGPGDGGNDGVAGEAGSGGERFGETAGGSGRSTGGDDAGAGGSAGAEPTDLVERWLAFRIEKQDDYTYPLFVVPVPAGSAPLPVAADIVSFQWSPDGKQLLYVSVPSGDAPNAAYLVTVSDGGVGEPEMIHPPLSGTEDRVTHASVSPNGQVLALQLFEDGVSRWYVRPMVSGSDAWNPVGEGADGEHVAEPGRRFSWSPDGERLAIVERESASHDRLLIVDSTGAGDAASFQDLSLIEWSRDSSHVLADGISSEPLGTRTLFWIDAASVSDIEMLTEPDVQSDFSLAQIAPDGSAVAFKAAEVSQFDLFVRSLDAGGALTKLDGVSVQRAAWLENSEGLLYWGYAPLEFTGPHLYAVPKDGSMFTKLNPDDTFALCNSGDCIRRAGNSFVFATMNWDKTGNQLYEATFAGTTATVRALTSFPDGTLVDSFEVGPDPTGVLVFVSGPASREVRYVDRSAAPPADRLVTAVPTDAYPFSFGAEGPPFSSDSRYAYYVANHDLDPDGMVDVFVSEIADGVPGTPAQLTQLGPTEQLQGVVWQP
jgi:hypothetical protein